MRIGNYHGKDFKECSDCYNKRVDVRVTKLQRKNFIISNWRTWLGTGIAIIFGIVGLSLL